MKKLKKYLLLLAMAIAFTNTTSAIEKADNSETIKNNDLQVINAAIKHPATGKAHFFVGKYFHMYNTTSGKLEKMGLIGKDGWYGLPANVDAALVHPINKKGYIFKGNMYYRYDFTKKKVDKKGIVGVDGFKGLNGPFDAAIMHPTNNKAYFFKGNKYYSYDLKTKKIAVKNTGKDSWKGMPGSIDAMIMHNNGKAYGFKEDHYYRYVFGKQVDKKAVIGRDGWKIFHQLDAVVFNDLDSNLRTRSTHFIVGKNAFYTSTEFSPWTIALTITLNDGYDHKVVKKKFGYDWYKGVPSSIDAGFLHPKNKRYYFFKDKMYYRYNPKSKKVDKTAKIKDVFGLSKIDAAAGIPNSNKVYLFLGDKYYLFNVLQNKITSSGTISSKFKIAPNYLDAAAGTGWGIRFYKKDVEYFIQYDNREYFRMLPSKLFK